jgi:hypothetical protein
MSNMKTLGMRGEMNVLLIPLIVLVLLFFGVGGFSYYAYSNMLKYKNNTNQLIASAEAVSNQQLTAKLQQEFAQESKSPYKTYSGPSAYGSISVTYPKTWSAYVSVDNTGSNTPIDGYFYPDVVPSTANASDGTGTNFALRVQVTQTGYSDVLQNYESQAQQGQIQVSPYHLPKVPSAIGVELTGQIESQKTGTMVILPVRNETLVIWTEGNQFQSDLNNIVLPNFTFSP